MSAVRFQMYDARNAIVREAAYLLAQGAGFEPGHELQDWLAAEHEVDALLFARIAPVGFGRDSRRIVNLGSVVSVRGSVVDVRFEHSLPPVYSVLRTGTQQQIVIEVLLQIDHRTVRGIALTATQGLARGAQVQDTGVPLQVPVGKSIRARMLDVFGNTIDRGPALTDVELHPVHRDPPPLAVRSTGAQIFETGIKVIDVLVPLERGGKAGLFGGAGVGKTVLLTELIHNMVAHQEASVSSAALASGAAKVRNCIGT